MQINCRGSILMVVLWSLCLLVCFSVILGFQVRQKASLIKRLDEHASIRFISEAGIRKAVSQILKEPEKPYDTFLDSWSNNPGAFRNINIGTGSVDVCYNYMDDQLQEAGLRYGMADEESKININNISDTNKQDMLQVLKRFFVTALGASDGEAEGMAACIIDWRDEDNELAVPFGGAESSYYSNLEHPYAAKNNRFETIDELLLVKGISEEIFRKVKSYLTIYGDGRVNVNTASKVVLLALGLSENLTDKIIAFRAGADGVTGTADDNFFDSSSNIIGALSSFARLSASETAELSNVAGKFLTVKSGNFSVRCLSKLANSRYINETDAVISRNGKIIYWQES